MLKKIVIILSLILWPLNFVLNFDKLHFSTETIFKNDYQGEQLILRNIHLYPTPFLARVFQNKPRIYITKYIGNFFTLTDINTYFFGTHPEPILGNVNMFKYPFLAIVFFLVGLLYITKSKYKKIVLTILIPTILILSCLRVCEGFDFILWLPITLIIIDGVNILELYNTRLFTYFSYLYILFVVPEIIRSFFNI